MSPVRSRQNRGKDYRAKKLSQSFVAGLLSHQKVQNGLADTKGGSRHRVCPYEFHESPMAQRCLGKESAPVGTWQQIEQKLESGVSQSASLWHALEQRGQLWIEFSRRAQHQ